MRFIDQAQIEVHSGRGGKGRLSFRRESRLPFGGPDGGNGGRGGHVIFQTDPSLSSLLDFQYRSRYKASDGKPGRGGDSTGAHGEDLVIKVPLGTLLKDMQGETLYDLDKETEFVFLEGGRGGKGNAFFKSSVNRAPQYAQSGEEGEKRDIQLELKLIADVGIIGLPNVGKSTLISRISAAKPKVSNYPFTTLQPNLGVVRYAKGQSFVVADVPGLIQGAHEGKGLGIHFLRHIERTKFLVHVLDVQNFEGLDMSQSLGSRKNKKNEKKESQEKQVWENYALIQKELREYSERVLIPKGKQSLNEKEQVLVFNKSENLSKEKLNSMLSFFEKKNLKVLPISALTGMNIQKLIFLMSEKVFGF